MELPASPSSHQFSTRKPGEPGLAEWAQKIRALQRQVDQDEEEEHRRLEQGIAASRLARVRRSAGYVPGMPYPSSVAGLHEDLPGDVVHSTLRHHFNHVTSLRVSSETCRQTVSSPSDRTFTPRAHISCGFHWWSCERSTFEQACTSVGCHRPYAI